MKAINKKDLVGFISYLKTESVSLRSSIQATSPAYVLRSDAADDSGSFCLPGFSIGNGFGECLESLESKLRLIQVSRTELSNDFIQRALGHIYNSLMKSGEVKDINLELLLKKESKKRGLADTPEWVFQRIKFSESLVTHLLNDPLLDLNIANRLEIIHIQFSIWLISPFGSMSSPNDRFRELLWKILFVARRSMVSSASHLPALVESILSALHSNKAINLRVLDALKIIDDDWATVSKKSKMVIDRSSLSWAGDELIAKSRQDIKNRVRSMISSKEIPQKVSDVLNSSIIPALLLFSLRKSVSVQDGEKFTKSIRYAESYISLRSRANITEISLGEIDDVYKNCEMILRESGNSLTDLVEDRNYFKRSISAAKGKKTNLVINGRSSTEIMPSELHCEPMIALLEAITINPLSTHMSTINQKEINDFREIGEGTWLALTNDKKILWKGFVAYKTDHSNSVIIAKKNGVKLDNISYYDIIKKMASGQIVIINDKNKFIDSVNMAIRDLLISPECIAPPAP